MSIGVDQKTAFTSISCIPKNGTSFNFKRTSSEKFAEAEREGVAWVQRLSNGRKKDQPAIF